MREYKFRAKCIEPLVSGDQWIYGFGVYTPELTDGTKEYWMYADHGIYEVDPETVGQYTGLKDRSGKEIYEGDILQDDYGNGEVEWVQEHCGYMVFTRNPSVYHRLDSDGHLNLSEVIGNRWDNPELLGG